MFLVVQSRYELGNLSKFGLLVVIVLNYGWMFLLNCFSALTITAVKNSRNINTNESDSKSLYVLCVKCTHVL